MEAIITRCKAQLPKIIIERHVVVNKKVLSTIKEHLEKSKQNIESEKEIASKDLKVKVAAPTRELLYKYHFLERL